MPSLCKLLKQQREIGLTKPLDTLNLIDHRIETLVSSWRYAIPFNAHAGTSAMDFDKAEDRFLLCGNSRGEVSIVDFESYTNKNPSKEHYPLNHKFIAKRRSGHKFMINGCQWYPVDTSIFTTTGMDSTLKIWDTVELKPIDEFKSAQPITDFQWFVSNTNASSLIALATASSNVLLLDPSTGNAIQQIRSQCERVWSVQWLPSQKYVLATGGDQGTITHWDIRSGKSELRKVQSPGGMQKNNNKRRMENAAGTERRKRAALAHLNRISCMQCSNDGRFTLSLTQDQCLCLWDSSTLKLLSWLKLQQPDSDANNSIPVKFKISDEGRSMWTFVPSGNEIQVVHFANPIKSDGKQLNANKEGCVHTLQGHFQSVIACAYRRRYQQLVSSSTDRLTLIWAPAMDETLFDVAAQNIQQLHQDAYSDDET